MKFVVNWKSLKTHIWLCFSLIVITILCLIWALEIVFYGQIYEMIRKKDLYDVVNKICTMCQVDNEDGISDLAGTNNVTVLSFSIDASEIVVNYSNAREGDILSVKSNALNLYKKLKDDKLNQVESITNTYPKTMFICKSFEIDGKSNYLYLVGVISPVDSNRDVMIFLFLLITVIAILLAIFMVTGLSKMIAKPIELISKNAEKLSSGDLDVKFNSCEYYEVEKLSDTLNYSIAEIKKSQDIQKEVVQNVSHELRTPLTMIKAYTELLQDYSAQDTQKRVEHLNIIYEESLRLEMLINDLLDLSKLQSKTMSYNMLDFDVCVILRKLEDYYIATYAEQGYNFIFSYPQSCIIYGDMMRMEQVICNLINNAINYSQTKKTIKVKLSTTKNGEMLLQVQDSGPGISKEDKKNIFDRHFRSNSSKRAVAGSGVGLTIVKEILNYHNFRFGVKSELGKGSTFFVLFEHKDIS